MFRKVMTSVLVLVAVTCIATVHAETIVLQDGLNGYAGTDDVSFWQVTPTCNQGADGVLSVGYQQYGSANWNTWLIESLVRFDLSSIPAGSTVNGATLTLTRKVVNSATVTNELFRVLPANAGWVEGTGGTPAPTGEPCWNYHSYNTVAWAGSAGLKTADTDYAATALDVPQPSNATVTFTFNDVSFFNGPSGWLANPSDNAGFLVRPVNGSGSGTWRYNQYYSSEDATVANRPVLTLDVTIIPEPSTLALLATGLIGLLCYAWRKRK